MPGRLLGDESAERLDTAVQKMMSIMNDNVQFLENSFAQCLKEQSPSNGKEISMESFQVNTITLIISLMLRKNEKTFDTNE